MTSKNNPARRAGRTNEKEYDGRKVKPVLYVGSFVGHSKYVAAQDEGGKMILDAAGKPIPFSQL
ncbi:MAG: hypothetical protein VCC99_16510 [Alphaproteobacteria bacterium]